MRNLFYMKFEFWYFIVCCVCYCYLLNHCMKFRKKNIRKKINLNSMETLVHFLPNKIQHAMLSIIIKRIPAVLHAYISGIIYNLKCFFFVAFNDLNLCILTAYSPLTKIHEKNIRKKERLIHWR